VLRRFLGLPPLDEHGGPPRAGSSTASGAGGPIDETATVRRIVNELASLPPDRARFLAAFAYILSREATADSRVTDAEAATIEQIVVEHGHMSPAQAVIVVQIARSQSLLFGATEDYLVTREFGNISTADERLDLLRCCFLVGSADGGISAEESGTLSEIADQLDVDRTAVHALRAEFADRMTAIQAVRAMRQTQSTTAPETPASATPEPDGGPSPNSPDSPDSADSSAAGNAG